jgi:hypothetical protein
MLEGAQCSSPMSSLEMLQSLRLPLTHPPHWTDVNDSISIFMCVCM